jgi:hypothetical protein
MDKDIDSLYNQHKDLVYSLVWQFIKAKRLPEYHFDELTGVANLSFVVAAHRFCNKSKNQFSTLLCRYIWGHLTTYYHKENREWEKIHKPRERFENKPKPIGKSPIGVWDELSTDSRILINYVLVGELDLEKTVYKKRSSIGYVFRFLRERQWSRKRINRCFKNLKNLWLYFVE